MARLLNTLARTVRQPALSALAAAAIALPTLATPSFARGPEIRLDAQMQSQMDEQAKQDTAAINGVAERLGKELQLAPDLAGAASASIAQLALQNSTRPDGKVDRTRFAQELKKLTDQAIAEANK